MIHYDYRKDFEAEQIKELFLSVHWASASYPEYQGLHIGHELMNRLMTQYENLLYIKIMPSDPATIPFYERFGFKQCDNYSAMEIKRILRLIFTCWLIRACPYLVGYPVGHLMGYLHIHQYYP